MDHLVQVKSLKGGSKRMNPSNSYMNQRKNYKKSSDSYMNQRKNYINPSLF